MTRAVDVVVVGARCAGSPLATLLARRGVRVAVVDQATFPSDTLSTHVFEADALGFLGALGVRDALLATGAPAVVRGDLRAADFHWVGSLPHRADDGGAAMSVRRTLLDAILASAAEDAGAELLTESKVTGLLTDDAGRVSGVRIGESELHARLVVGADGRNSTVAGLCGARMYNVTQNERAAYWGFFESADLAPAPTFFVHRWADRLLLAMPADSGLFQVALMPRLAELADFKRDLEASFIEYALSCEPVANALSGARRVGKLMGCVRWTCFFREPAGPGWALVGDAGHFKDPAAGRGIGDAFRQAETLAPVIADGIAGSDAGLDSALERWGRERDAEFAEYYWLGTDLGSAQPIPAVLPEVIRGLDASGKIDAFFDVNNHRVRPTEVLTLGRLAGATARTVRRSRGHRLAVLREVGQLAAETVRRQRLNRRPVYAETSG